MVEERELLVAVSLFDVVSSYSFAEVDSLPQEIKMYAMPVQQSAVKIESFFI